MSAFLKFLHVFNTHSVHKNLVNQISEYALFFIYFLSLFFTKWCKSKHLNRIRTQFPFSGNVVQDALISKIIYTYEIVESDPCTTKGNRQAITLEQCYFIKRRILLAK